MHNHLPEYAAYLHMIGARPRGADRYARMIRAFLDHERIAEPHELTHARLRAYLLDYSTRHRPSTTSLCRAALRSFCAFLLDAELLDHDPSSRLRVPRRQPPLPRALTTTELDDLRHAIEQPSGLPQATRWQWQRNRRVVCLCLYAGCRISEAAALRWHDVDIARRQLVVRDGKGGKSRAIPMHGQLIAELERVRDPQPGAAVAGRADGKPLHLHSIDHIFSRWLPARGVLGVTAHRLRHTLATQLYEAGCDIYAIQQILGHASPDTTRIYVAVSAQRLHDSMEQLQLTM